MISAYTNLQKLLMVIAVSLVGILLVPIAAKAADPYGRYGFVTLFSDILGDDPSCGLGTLSHEFYLRELGTDNPVTNVNALFIVMNSNNGSIASSVTGSGPVIGPLCYNPVTQKVGISIDGGSSYYNLEALYSWASGSIGEKKSRSTAWLVPNNGTSKNYDPTGPVGVLTQSPDYSLQINYMPTLYGTTDVYFVAQFLIKYDPVSDTKTVVNSRSVLVGGGVGMKTLPAIAGLSDGIYYWAYYIMYNGTHDAGGVRVAYEPASAYGESDMPFLIDTTAPSFGTPPEASFPEIGVASVSASASDAVSGLTEMIVYVDDAEAKRCLFASKSNATCKTDPTAYESGSTHSIYVTAKDAAGNTATSTAGSFTMPSILLPPNYQTGQVTPNDVGYGTSFTFTSSVTNTSDSLIGTSTALLQRSIDSSGLGITDIATSTFDLPEKNSFESVSFSYFVPQSDAGKEFYLRACADQTQGSDTEGKIEETEEADNCGAWSKVRVTPLPPIVSLRTNKTSLVKGESAILEWEVKPSADNCTASGDWSGSKTPNGVHQETVTPLTNSTYSLTCFKAGVMVPVQSVSITVLDPTVVCPSDTIDHCVLPITNRSESKDGTCSAGYTGACNYLCGVSGSWSVTANTCSITSTYDGYISASETTVSYGDTTKITWEVSGDPGALDCSVVSVPAGDSWDGYAFSNKMTSPLYETTTYVLSCNGTPVDSVTIVVNPDVTISASSPVVRKNTDVVISWNTNGNDESTCNLTGKGVSNAQLNGTGQGSASVTISDSTVFTLTCGMKSAKVFVSIVPANWES